MRYLAEEMMDMTVDELLDNGVSPANIWTNELGEMMLFDIDTFDQFIYEQELLSSLPDELTEEQLDLFHSDIEGNA